MTSVELGTRILVILGSIVGVGFASAMLPRLWDRYQREQMKKRRDP